MGSGGARYATLSVSLSLCFVSAIFLFVFFSSWVGTVVGISVLGGINSMDLEMRGRRWVRQDSENGGLRAMSLEGFFLFFFVEMGLLIGRRIFVMLGNSQA